MTFLAAVLVLLAEFIGWDCLRVLYSARDFWAQQQSNFTSNGTQRGTNEILKFGRTISQGSTVIRKIESSHRYQIIK